MTEQWLRCHILQGMFSDERTIVVYSKSGERIAEFVPKDKVVGEINEDGKLRVKVFQNNGTTWAVLPTDYSESIPVRNEDLVTA